MAVCPAGLVQMTSCPKSSSILEKSRRLFCQLHKNSSFFPTLSDNLLMPGKASRLMSRKWTTCQCPFRCSPEKFHCQSLTLVGMGCEYERWLVINGVNWMSPRASELKKKKKKYNTFFLSAVVSLLTGSIYPLNMFFPLFFLPHFSDSTLCSWFSRWLQ